MIFIKNNNGQIALVMVLIMTVVSAVVVSVASRVTTETRIQQLSKDSSDAFLTAQEGLDAALTQQTGVSLNGLDKSYNVTLNSSGQNGLLTEKINSGSSVDVVLNASPLLQAIKIYWKSVSDLPLSILVTKYSSGLIEDMAYDSLGINGFSVVNLGGSLSGTVFPYATPLISMDPSITRVKITVYGDAAFLGIEPVGDLLPVQLLTYKSESSIGAGRDKVKYGLEYEETKNSKLPEVFDYALFSLGSIIQ